MTRVPEGQDAKASTDKYTHTLIALLGNKLDWYAAFARVAVTRQPRLMLCARFHVTQAVEGKQRADGSQQAECMVQLAGGFGSKGAAGALVGKRYSAGRSALRAPLQASSPGLEDTPAAPSGLHSEGKSHSQRTPLSPPSEPCWHTSRGEPRCCNPLPWPGRSQG